MTTPTLLALADRIEVVCNNASPVNHGSGSIFWMTARDWSHELRALAAPQVEIQLPELPEPQKECWIGHDLYSADQMHAYAQAALNARAGGDGGMVERMYQALWFAQPFIAYAAKNAENPRLAKECLTAMNASIEEYRALASQAVGVKS